MENKKPESFFSKYGLLFALIVAMIATLGSLTFSEVLHWTPCELCWFQRIFMYPLVILLGVANFKGDRKITSYILPLSIIGGCISLYHTFLQWFPSLEKTAPCQRGIPCNHPQLELLGFITIPFLALVAFILITFFMFMVRKSEKNKETSE